MAYQYLVVISWSTDLLKSLSLWLFRYYKNLGTTYSCCDIINFISIKPCQGSIIFKTSYEADIQYAKKSQNN